MRAKIQLLHLKLCEAGPQGHGKNMEVVDIEGKSLRRPMNRTRRDGDGGLTAETVVSLNQFS